MASFQHSPYFIASPFLPLFQTTMSCLASGTSNNTGTPLPKLSQLTALANSTSLNLIFTELHLVSPKIQGNQRRRKKIILLIYFKVIRTAVSGSMTYLSKMPRVEIQYIHFLTWLSWNERNLKFSNPAKVSTPCNKWSFSLLSLFVSILILY